MKQNKLRCFVAIGSVAALLWGCSGADDASDVPADVLASVGQSRLTLSELRGAMPGGLSADDSVKFATAYINSWVDSRLVSRIAAEEVDMSEIDEMVDRYRRELVLRKYTLLRAEAMPVPDFPADTIKAYFDANPKEFVLSRPMVKGIYLKVPDDAKNLAEIRRLCRSSRADDIDRLEKASLQAAVHYDYFRDRWIDWEQIESRIPMPMGDSPDDFIRANKYIDFSSGGFTYILSISDYLPTGAAMPLDAATPAIEERLRFEHRRRFEASILSSLREEALADGRLKLY